MELVWEDPPVPSAPFFTRDVYDKYCLAPTVRELWEFLQSPAENDNLEGRCDAEGCTSIILDSCESDDLHADNSAEAAEDCKNAKKSKQKNNRVENEARAAYPEPRLPFPCVSTLSSKDQSVYLGFLMNQKTGSPPQNLQGKVNNEVMQFMRYVQDVAKICADDYNFISQGALQYSEEFFRGCLECIKTIPQLYQIHEMTSLTGGTFNPGLELTFEKQLLIMGDVDITDHKIVPADAQLASDYQSVSSENPPAKKAKDMHATISSDGNAEKLCARYEPHVCMTHNALVKLLDNHGPDFTEPWELPVWIKLNPRKGSNQKKTVYIDSPLLKTEMTMRERSHLYHEESLKLSIKKNGRKNVFHLMTELPANEEQHSSESSQRNLVSFENDGLGFEADLTDLETFGDTTSIKVSKTPKVEKWQPACVKNKKVTSSSPLCKSKTSSNALVNTSNNPAEDDLNTSLTDGDDHMTKETDQPVVAVSCVSKTEQEREDSAEESAQDLSYKEDSDEEKLVIDDSVSPVATPVKQLMLNTSPCPSEDHQMPESVPLNSESASPQNNTRQTRKSKKSKPGDQLGEILRMQTAMFNSANTNTGKCSTGPQETNSSTRCIAPPAHSNPTSLVKSCVTSYLERNQSQDGETCTSPQKSAPAVNISTTEHKKILSQDLQVSAEDEQDYQAPEEGNLLYKLYSLQDLLLMVRSSVSLTHSRKIGSQNQYVPVHVLPKLEYQLSYGVECLTSSEACQLWTETLLHPSTVSYVAHINAHSSKVALLRKLPVNWKQTISCAFKPSKSLNILHHLLQKLKWLDEGRYLIAHKAGEPFVTLLKAATGKGSRGAYNLQQLHSSVPQAPGFGFIPWIPVDPAVVLPFHQAHGRVPCTFPPKPFLKTTRDEQSNNHGAGQPTNKRKKKKQTKRTTRRNKYIKQLIKKSV